MTRAPKPKPPPSFTPHQCVVVGADPGENSGWSIRIAGKLEDFGECDVFGGGPQRVLEKALELARERNLPCALVTERPFRVRYGTQTGIGTAELIWRTMAKRLGFARRIIRIWPASWRAAVLGKGWGGGKRSDREKVRAEEQRRAALDAIDSGVSKVPGPDSSPAVLISRWGSYAGQVAEALSKQRARRAG